MPTNYVNAGGSWRNLSKIFANVGGTWKTVIKGFANVAGVWKQFFGALEIESRVEISASPTSWGDSLTGPTLTGKYYHWDDTAGMVDLTYIFQKSTVASNDDANWTDIGTPQIITTNPQASTFGTKTYVIPESDFSSSITTIYYRFVVYATSGDLSNSSKSTYLTMNYTLPIGQAGSVQFARSANTGYVYSVSNTGTWSNSPNSYLYQWQWLNTATSTWTNISGATASSYTVPSTYWTKYIRPRIYAQNSVGTSNYPIYPTEPLLVHYKTPTIGSFSVTGGVTYVSYSYTFSADDPDRVLTISYTGTSSGSFTPNLANGTYSLPAGTYNFTLKVQNTTINGNGLYAESTVSNITVTGVTVPSAPTIGTVTRTNNTTVSIPFSAPSSNGGGTITSYVATSNPSRTLSVTGTTSPLSVSGTFGIDTGYTFQIAAVNSAGTGTYSASSNSVIVNQATVPGAPTIGTATASTTVPTRATVGWSAPASNGGATITLYTATSSPGGITGTLNPLGNTSGFITVDGLSENTSYTFTVTATNSAGTSSPSAASNQITTYITIPNLLGLSESTATLYLSSNGFPYTIGPVLSNNEGATAENNGTVGRQTPFPGDNGVYVISPGTSFTLRIYQYNYPPTGATAFISGNPAYGQTLTLNETGPTQGATGATETRSWQRNSGSGGAWTTVQNYGTSYVLGSQDLTYSIRCYVVWTNSYGTQTIITNTIGPIGPADLTGLSVSSFTSGSLSLTWNASGGAGSYAVVIGGPNGISTSTTSTSYSISGLISGSNYGISVTPYTGTSGNGTAGVGMTASKQPGGQDTVSPFFPPYFPTFTAPPYFPTFTAPPYFPTFTAPPYFPTFTPAGCTPGAYCGSGYTCYPEGFYTSYNYDANCNCVLTNGFC